MALNATEVERPNGVEIDSLTYEEDFHEWESELEKPHVLTVEDLSYENEIYSQTRAMLASVALGVMVEVTDERTEQSLMQSAKEAGHNPEARNMVKLNAKTDYLERTYKSGHVTKVRISTEQGQLGQHGQSISSVNANSLRHLQDDTLRSRARIETHNAFRQQRYYEEGLLDNHTMVTFSLVPERISAEHAKTLGFFTENMSLAIQAAGNADEKGLELESAFVSGADAPEKRFDREVVVALLQELGVDASGMDTEQLLAYPVLIPNERMKNGVIDIVSLYDQFATKFTGYKRFFGRKSEEQLDYISHKKECLRREQVADKVAERTTRKLIAESATFARPTDATRRLHELNDAELKRRIVSDKSIDVNVLGLVATEAVKQARMYFETNDMFHLQQSMQEINSRGVSSSCPNASQSSSESSVAGMESLGALSASSEKEDVGGKKEMTCPFCEEKTVGDPCADCITCTKCSASTKYSSDENKRRAEQYRKIKQVKNSSDDKIESYFKSLISSQSKPQATGVKND